tara:strand:- start:185 stop:382 length:198 start_codon:yes stop_codon:yes gene_type:complete
MEGRDMLEVGNIVKSKYIMEGHRARIGLVMKVLRDGSEIAQVYWPHNRTFSFVKCKDMEIVNEDG